ncbi:MAG: polysaccharide biosynthesis tyrosine autokinase [Gammaproteobacteria bacterium]|nr:polysaccharide biosynthesis tyrosine autokinase [Gammaproteobacteria bacterium]
MADDDPAVRGRQPAPDDAHALIPLRPPQRSGTAVVRYEKNLIGRLLAADGKISATGIHRVLRVQSRDGTRKFGELAVGMSLVSERDVQIALCRQFGYPSVEDLEGRLGPELYMALAPFSPAAELLNKVLAQLPRTADGEEGLSIAIVSPDPKEGRSTLAANLALAYAQSGRRTLLIDADLRKPSQHRLFGLGSMRGLTSLSSDWYAGDEVLDLVHPAHLFGLSIVQAGSTYANPIEVLNNERFAKLVADARVEYEAVIIDTPPARSYADAEAIAAVAARMLIVTREHYSQLESVRSIVDSARRHRVEVLGAVLGR